MQYSLGVMVHNEPGGNHTGFASNSGIIRVSAMRSCTNAGACSDFFQSGWRSKLDSRGRFTSLRQRMQVDVGSGPGGITLQGSEGDHLGLDYQALLGTVDRMAGGE